MSENTKVRENQVRRQLARQGYRLQKSRSDGTVRVNGVYQGVNMDDQGGYQIVDDNTEMIVAGEKFDLSLEDVERLAAEDDTYDQAAGLEESAQEWAREQADIWEAQQREEWLEAAGAEFDEWADEERERWQDEGLTEEEEELLQSQLDEAREDWDEDEQGDFDEWAAEERARWEEWDEKDEEKF